MGRLPMAHDDVLDDAAKRLYDTWLLGAAPAGPVRDWLHDSRNRFRFMAAFRSMAHRLLDGHAEDLRLARPARRAKRAKKSSDTRVPPKERA